MQKNKFRKFINDIHLWLGLISGIILFIICLSGTIYTFKNEIEYLINPDKYNSSFYSSTTSNKKEIELEKLIRDLQKKEKAKVVSVTLPEDKYKNYELALVKKEPKKESKGREPAVKNNAKNDKPQRVRPVTYYIDPYTGEIRGKDGDSTSKFFISMMKLHRWLLLDDSIGRPIVGIATLIFIVLSLSGLILWLPRKFKHCKRWFYWKPGFKIKHTGNWKRINHDLHNTLGFYSLFFLLIMAITGLCWSFDWYRDGLSKLLGSEVFGGRNEKAPEIQKAENSTLSWEELLKISKQQLPYEGTIKLIFPKDSTTALTIQKTKDGFCTLQAPDKLNINPYNGEVISKDLFEDKPLNVQITALIKPIHLGEVYGTLSKIIYFITCLIGTSLPVTGTIIWLNKMRKNK